MQKELRKMKSSVKVFTNKHTNAERNRERETFFLYKPKLTERMSKQIVEEKKKKTNQKYVIGRRKMFQPNSSKKKKRTPEYTYIHIHGVYCVCVCI